MMNNMSADTPENAYPKSVKDATIDKHAEKMMVVFKETMRGSDGKLRSYKDTPAMMHDFIEKLVPLSLEFAAECGQGPWSPGHAELYVGMIGQVAQALEQSLQNDPTKMMMDSLQKLAAEKGIKLTVINIDDEEKNK